MVLAGGVIVAAIAGLLVKKYNVDRSNNKNRSPFKKERS